MFSEKWVTEKYNILIKCQIYLYNGGLEWI